MRLNRVEDVIIKTEDKDCVLKAKVDTGADRTSIDESLVNELGLELLDEFKQVRSANGMTKRQLVKVNYVVQNKPISTTASVTDRSHLNYKMIIGCNDLSGCEVLV